MMILSTPVAKQVKLWLLVLLACCILKRVDAQGLLNKPISISAQQKKLADVLNELSSKGGFYFSYDGRLLQKDSLVTLTADQEAVSGILFRLFQNKYQYEERRNYVIITPTLQQLSLINTDLTTDNNSYSVSGLVVDTHTGERLMNASVYEKDLLVATLTDEHGYFRLKFRMSDPGQIIVTASKRLYRDTTVHFLQTISVSSRFNSSVYSNATDKGNRVERTGLGRVFISTRQKIQSLNIPDFFAKRPFQVSLTPGLSTHGMFSPQVVNKFSLNLLGGYTAGVDGMEVGGLFNINKQDTKYLQLAGIFNLAGGNATGLQVAGVHNRALDTVRGAQLSLFTNNAGAQLSGLQLSALHNETHKLKGLQIGLVNEVDTSEGASIGLINIIGNGFYKVTYSASDMSNANISLKTGTHAFYSELLTSSNISAKNKFYAFGLGIGHDFMFSNRIYLSAEANYQFANTGLWDDRWQQGKLLLNVQLTKNISLVGGPTFNHYMHRGSFHLDGYKNVTNIPEYPAVSAPYQSKNWVGWEAGIAFNSVFKRAKKVADDSQSWYLDFAATGGIGWDDPYKFVSGGELSLQRDLGEQLTGTLSAGVTHFSVEKNYLFAQVGNNVVYAQSVTIIPVKAGIRLATGKIFYIAGEIGEAFGNGQSDDYDIFNNNSTYTANSSFHSFMFSASGGFSFKNGLETGIKFDDYGFYKQFALRLGYRLKLSHN